MKTAIVGYISGLAFQLAGRGRPGQRGLARATPTSRAASGSSIEQGDPELYAIALGLNPTGRMGTPEEMAARGGVPGQPGVQPHHRHQPRRRRRADPGHPAVASAHGAHLSRPADAPEPDEESEPDFAELAADLSDQWLVEVAVGEDGDDACFGPLAARPAWDLAVEIDDKRPEWTVLASVPLYVAEPADRIIELFEDD